MAPTAPGCLGSFLTHLLVMKGRRLGRPSFSPSSDVHATVFTSTLNQPKLPAVPHGDVPTATHGSVLPHRPLHLP